MKDHPIFSCAAVFASAALAAWLFGGFVVLDWDIRNWHAAGRFSMLWISTGAVCMYMIFRHFK